MLTSGLHALLNTDKETHTDTQIIKYNFKINKNTIKVKRFVTLVPVLIITCYSFLSLNSSVYFISQPQPSLSSPSNSYLLPYHSCSLPSQSPPLVSSSRTGQVSHEYQQNKLQ